MCLRRVEITQCGQRVACPHSHRKVVGPAAQVRIDAFPGLRVVTRLGQRDRYVRLLVRTVGECGVRVAATRSARIARPCIRRSTVCAARTW